MGAQQSAVGDAANSNGGAAAPNAASSSGAQQQSERDNEQLPLYSYTSIARHNSPGDCWLLLHGLVYDVTAFLRQHPGGQQLLLDVAGVDGSEAFDEAAHPEYVLEDMQRWLVGRLDKQSAPAEATPEAEEKEAAADEANEGKNAVRVRFLYGSQLGQSQRYAEQLAEACTQLSPQLSSSYLSVSVSSMGEYDAEDLGGEEIVVLVCSTYTEGKAPDNAQHFCSWMEEAAVDFRVGEGFMNLVRFAVLGLGNSLYENHYNAVAKKLYSQSRTMGGTALCALGLVDESVSRPDQLCGEDDFKAWMDAEFLPNLVLSIEQPKAFEQKVKIAQSKEKTALRAQARKERREREKREAREYNLNAPDALDADEEAAQDAAKRAAERAARGEAEQSDEDEDESDQDSAQDSGDDDEADEDGEGSDGEKVVDLEELGNVLNKQKGATSSSSGKESEKPAPRAMLTDQLRKNLSKQGYKLIGSHSGVKLCRWTKAMLRGRGGCYKHTMYGIVSYSCMEMTPSLACANKCVFCWRHHTNPVGKEWRWQVDPPRMILDSALVNHKSMINTLKGVPGVIPERLADAQKPRHCALSLVGEPIMYPHISEFTRMLHEEDISSFLVTNAQFPQALIDLEPVCQLYVSIDASTPESLKAVDRPLFADYWQRFLDSLAAIREKQQRTVYRLTLVKTFNMQEVIEYAKLIAMGRPTFIEIKGVTFCGKSGAGDITLRDVPLHEEVCAFAEQLCKYLDGSYELASEHAHSCCVLIADAKLKVDGKWHTWIDYKKFNQLVRAYYADNTKTFSAMDYAAETPHWAVYGAKEAGFSPAETKKQGKRARPTLEELNKKFPGVNEEVRQAQLKNIQEQAASLNLGGDAATSSSSSIAAATN